MQWIQRNLPSVTIAAVLTSLAVMAGVYIWSVVERVELTALLSGIALVAGIVLMAFVMLIPDDTQSQQTERILNMASRTFIQMRGGLTTETCQATCRLVLEETNAMAVGMTSATTVLGYAGEAADEFPVGSPIRTRETHAVLASGRLEIFSPIRVEDGADGSEDVPAGIIVPLKVQDKVVGTIKFYFRSPADIDRTQVVIARGIGDLLSTQLNAHALDRQSELTAIAEVKALQAQINPHFLFNTLNTIASFTRTDPERAHELLREFAAFYRQTLEGSGEMVPLAREVEQTERYLTFEIARFGASRIVETSHIERGLEDVPVPSFIVQPIVENAVRHAMSDEGALHIDIQATSVGDDLLIAVVDDGLGMDEDVASALLGTPEVQSVDVDGTPRDPGAHIALRNIAGRLERTYGEGSGVEIVSKPGSGTSVTLCLVGALAREDA